MEYPVRHRCGHEQRHAIFRTFAAEADREVERLARRKCTPCWRQDKQSAERPLDDASRTALEAIALSALIGSAKQVAWAEKIRAARIASLHRAGCQDGWQLAAVDQAKWWIDNRDRQDADLLTLCTEASLA